MRTPHPSSPSVAAKAAPWPAGLARGKAAAGGITAGPIRTTCGQSKHSSIRHRSPFVDPPPGVLPRRSARSGRKGARCWRRRGSSRSSRVRHLDEGRCNGEGPRRGPPSLQPLARVSLSTSSRVQPATSVVRTSPILLRCRRRGTIPSAHAAHAFGHRSARCGRHGARHLAPTRVIDASLRSSNESVTDTLNAAHTGSR